MASILIYIELEGGRATDDALMAVNEGRRVGSDLGATVYAMLPCADPPSYGDNDIISMLALHGADKVILLTHPGLAEDARAHLVGHALHTACLRFPPRLVLLPGSTRGQTIAPSLSMKLGGEFWSLDRLPGPRGKGHRWTAAAYQPLRRTTEPLVITLEESIPPRPMGDDEAEVIVLHVDLPDI